MPLLPMTPRREILVNIPHRILEYNSGPRGPKYNGAYKKFIEDRQRGIATHGNVENWLSTEQAGADIYALVGYFGMKGRGKLQEDNIFARGVGGIRDAVDIKALSEFRLEAGPLSVQSNGISVAHGLRKLYEYCFKPGRFSESGGFVIASKVAHAVLPELCPMLDRKHVALSLYNMREEEYLPPGDGWRAYLGYQPKDKMNPSPRGGGGTNWGADQFLGAIGFYARIYNDWQQEHGDRGNEAFLRLDPVEGATGVPRLLDKVFW